MAECGSHLCMGGKMKDACVSCTNLTLLITTLEK